MPASFLTELVLRPLFEVVLYGVGYMVGVVVVPIFSLGMYTVESWDFQVRAKARKRSNPLAPRVVSADVATGIGLATLVAAALIGFFLWRAAGA
jgi:hypothetical protein